MIHTIIQIFVMALLFFAIFRESKRDRLNQMQQIDDIRKFFALQAEYIDRQAKQLSSVIKAQIELTYTDRHDEVMQEIKAIGTCLSDFNSQLSTLNSQLASIEAPIKLWGEAQVKNEIKKGEANRTLRHKLQQNREYIKSMEQSLQVGSNRLSALSTELEQAKAAARDIVAETMKEISLIRSWMEERGVPIAPLDKHLSKEFKGNIPSQVYTRTKNEQALQESLSN
jgi:predicted  nucleic acid-binding Zn-ribbon protein